jgi:hypothetical protein
MRSDYASWCCSVDTRARPMTSARQAASSNSINTQSATSAKARHRAGWDSQWHGLSGRRGRRHQRSPPIARCVRLCQGPHRSRISDPGEPPKGGFAGDRSSMPSLQYRHSPRAVLLMSAVTNREATHEACSNIPMLACSPDVLPPDPYPFLGEAPAPDPRLISSPREKPVPLPSML